MQKVYKFPRETRTVSMFEYGNGWRVKYVITDNDPIDTHLLDFCDEFFDTKSEANVFYSMLCALLSIRNCKINNVETQKPEPSVKIGWKK